MATWPTKMTPLECDFDHYKIALNSSFAYRLHLFQFIWSCHFFSPLPQFSHIICHIGRKSLLGFTVLLSPSTYILKTTLDVIELLISLKYFTVYIFHTYTKK